MKLKAQGMTLYQLYLTERLVVKREGRVVLWALVFEEGAVITVGGSRTAWGLDSNEELLILIYDNEIRPEMSI